MLSRLLSSARSRGRSDDHSSRLRVSPKLQQPTRKHGTGQPRPAPEMRTTFPVWPCSVWGLPDDPLPNRRCALTAPFHPYLRPFGPSAVSFLLHFPSLTGPRITRHTALWSSDFPL